MGLLEGLVEGAEEWEDFDSNNDGRVAAIAGLSWLWSVLENTVIQAQVRTTVWQQDLGKEQVRQSVVGTLGVSHTFK